MNPSTLALLVVLWPGHDIGPQPLDASECQQAADAIRMAAQFRDKKYEMDSGVKAFCIPLTNEGTNQIIHDLLAPPPPSTPQPRVPVIVPPRNHPEERSP